jgi:hypothetical protein
MMERDEAEALFDSMNSLFDSMNSLFDSLEFNLRAMVARGAPPPGVVAPMDSQIKRAILEASADILRAIKLSVIEVFREAQEASQETKQGDRG